MRRQKRHCPRRERVPWADEVMYILHYKHSQENSDTQDLQIVDKLPESRKFNYKNLDKLIPLIAN